jgi:hypothetical protein
VIVILGVEDPDAHDPPLVATDTTPVSVHPLVVLDVADV